jgi:hypothetical protein
MIIKNIRPLYFNEYIKKGCMRSVFYSPSDTIKYNFYIKDRAENLSNIASTNEIVLSVNNIY